VPVEENQPIAYEFGVIDETGQYSEHATRTLLIDLQKIISDY